MKQNPINKGLLNSTYDYSKLIKMQSEEVTSKVDAAPAKKKTLKRVAKEGVKRKRIS